MDRRKLLILQQKKEGLPDGYTQLEYLQSDGTQWINTEYILQGSDTVELKAEYVRRGSLKYSTAYFCGCDITYQKGFSLAEDSKAHGVRKVLGDVMTYSEVRPNVGIEFVVVSSISLLRVVVGEEITEISKSTQTYTPLDWPLYLFNTNRNGTAFDGAAFIGKIYYAKITNSQGEMTLNCIPCLDVDRVPCMFDLVSRKSFYNVGSGSFTWG